MNEERDERTFAKMEQQIAKQEMSLRGMNDRERTWFQSMKQRRNEKDRLDSNFKDAEAAKKAASGEKVTEEDLKRLSASKRKKLEDAEKKKTPSQLAKQRVRDAQEKASFLRAKANKTAMKTKRIRQVDAPAKQREAAKNKKTSRFAVDLTNTSRRNAKKLRYGLLCCWIASNRGTPVDASFGCTPLDVTYQL